MYPECPKITGAMLQNVLEKRVSVIYYRSENLLPCIILHGLFDFANYFWICFANNVNDALNVQNTTDINVVSAFVLIAMCLLFVILGLWQLRTVFKNKPSEEVKWTDQD